MNAIAWTLTALLGTAFLGAAAFKLLLAKPALREKGLLWVDDFSQTSVKGIALVEFAGACGLVLPWTLHEVQNLTPLAAVGLTIAMVSAAIVHLRRHENAQSAAPLVLAALSAGLAAIRFGQL